jgi:hypothetical protein
MLSPVVTKTYGTVSADRQKEMSGLEFVQGLVKRDAASQYDRADLGV